MWCYVVYSACKVEMCLFEVSVPSVFTALGAHPPPFNGYQGLKGLGEKLNAHLDRIPRIRMSGVVPLLPQIPSWRAQEDL
jgi:hypothetical protein